MKRSLIRRILAGLGLIRLSNRLELVDVDSSLFGRRLTYALLRPPGPSVPDCPVPVVYLLHGLGDDCRALDRYGVSDHLFQAMDCRRIPCVNLVLPSGERGFYIDWYDGSHPYESHIVEEVLPAAEDLLGAGSLDRELRHIAGVSMGGIGAMQIGLRHPDRFASIASLSGPLLDERQAIEHLHRPFNRWFIDLKSIFGDGVDRDFLESHNPWSIARRRGPNLGQRLFLAAGCDEKPFFRATTRSFHEFLDRLGVVHHYELYAGGHGWCYWAPVIERAIAHGTASPDSV